MKKFILLFITSCSLTVFAMAQAYEGTTTFSKKKEQAILIDYNYSPEAVQNAFTGKMASLGYKPKEEKGLFNRDKGFLVFKNTLINEISGDRLDYIVNIVKQSRKAKDEATLYLILQEDGDNIFSKSDNTVIDNAKNFLNNMIPDIEAADLELQIKAQEDIIVKSEKKFADLKSDQTSLEKKLLQNKADQENTQKDIANQKQALGVLVGKRKTN
jgi:hypothetical protein